MTIQEEERQILVGAMDSLASALAVHKHWWSEGEKTIYEEALRILGVEELGEFREIGENDSIP